MGSQRVGHDRATFTFQHFVSSSLVAQLIKNPPVMRETWVQSLGWEDPQEKGMATHSSILAWRTPWTEDPGGLQPMGVAESDIFILLTSPMEDPKAPVRSPACCLGVSVGPLWEDESCDIQLTNQKRRCNQGPPTSLPLLTIAPSKKAFASEGLCF